ncbi:MAG: hypothetical protein HY867_09415 [Chloroflexi bacterium]|nr:hypothetical protein [Chloroflexota bacterium]
MKTRSIAIAALLLMLLLSACGPQETPMPTPDIGAIQTAAAQTVVAEILATQSAEAALTPLASPTAQPTNTPAESPTVTVTMTVGVLTTPGLVGTPLGLCDDASYNLATVDVTVSDGTVIAPGAEFLKTWKIRNTGSCSWGAGYTVVFGYGERMNGQPAALNTTVTPGQEVDVSVQFKAPTTVGEYKSWWRMANARGSAFGQFFSVWIIVR